MSQQRAFKVRVVEVIAETPDARSIVVEPEVADASHFGYRPGQFLTLNIPTDREGGAARCYSLSSSPSLDERLKITVKRTEGGYGSNWVCDHLGVDDVIEVLAPSGTFTPRSLDVDFLLFAAGSGITPVMSILKTALHEGSGKVALVYANRDEQSVIFRDELVALEKAYDDRLQVIHLLESVQGLPRARTLEQLAGMWADRHVFMCGPEPFMDAVTAAVSEAGVTPDRVHHEKFLSLGSDPFADSVVELDDAGPTSTVEVTLDGATTTLAWPRSNKLLDVLLAAGLEAPYSCREGNCSACACIVLEGDLEMERNEVLEAEDIAEGIVLGCQAVPLSDRLRITYDQ
ncbi:ferredoxin--NADP reductase [Nocardioides sp. Soil796]|uniref:ferredoxin--NADP reductase n=1 Tax=Nocardioides sp. Soil796 TaxID=1736412 RepID=UPI00070DE467|nr:ferredoxin--NADP reductase [Nocardioides sp. Soil796]KRF10455.1 3-ketosteroid-9-alpha-hydroxylase [Nocardioides sp. Soil796]